MAELEDLEERRVRLAGHILRADDTDPMGQVFYQHSSGNPLQIGKRRVGRPRQQWVFKTNEAIHNRIRQSEYDIATIGRTMPSLKRPTHE